MDKTRSDMKTYSWAKKTMSSDLSKNMNVNEPKSKRCLRSSFSKGYHSESPTPVLCPTRPIAWFYFVVANLDWTWQHYLRRLGKWNQWSSNVASWRLKRQFFTLVPPVLVKDNHGDYIELLVFSWKCLTFLEYRLHVAVKGQGQCFLHHHWYR